MGHIPQNLVMGETSLGIWLGIFNKVQKVISYWILIDTGHLTPSTTVHRLTNIEMKTTDNKRILSNFESKVEAILDITNIDLQEQK